MNNLLSVKSLQTPSNMKHPWPVLNKKKSNLDARVYFISQVHYQEFDFYIFNNISKKTCSKIEK